MSYYISHYRRNILKNLKKEKITKNVWNPIDIGIGILIICWGLSWIVPKKNK